MTSLTTFKFQILLLLQSQIPQSKSSFQHKLKRQTDEGRLYYLKEQYNVKMGLYENPNSRKQRKTHTSLKHTFLKTVRTFHQLLINMCDTDSYWH